MSDLNSIRKKILIVDDEEKLCKMLKLNLEKEGPYEVQYQTKAPEAFNTAKTFKPDLVVMDVMMPDLGGCEIAYQLRADASFTKLPIVFLTALAQKREKEIYGGIVDGRPFIAKPVLSKPIKTKDLIKAIESLLNPQVNSETN